MRMMIMTLVLLALAASAASAEGLHARIQGPDPDGFYTARTIGLAPGDVLEPWAYAEGAFEGRPRSVLIRLQPTSEPGTYRFARTWPADGRWMIRYCLGHPPAPATVAGLRADGRVTCNRLYWKTDGASECRRVLKKYWTRWKEKENC